MKKKILLTGSSGFVGGNFLNLYKDQFEFISVSLREQRLDDINFKGVDCVLHCAALVHQMKGAPENDYFRVNYELTKTLAENAKKAGVEQFIFLSTAHVFGDSGTLYDHEKRFSEDSACSPKDAYGKSKYAAEQFLLSMQNDFFKVAIIRPPMIYGKGAKGNINSLIKLVKLMPFLPLAFPKNKRSVVFIENLCYFIKLVVEKRAQGVLLVQDETPISLEKLIRDIAAALKKSSRIFSPPTLLLKVLFRLFPQKAVRLFGTLALDSKKSNAILGYIPPYSTTEGLKKMVTNSTL